MIALKTILLVHTHAFKHYLYSNVRSVITLFKSTFHHFYWSFFPGNVIIAAHWIMLKICAVFLSSCRIFVIYGVTVKLHWELYDFKQRFHFGYRLRQLQLESRLESQQFWQFLQCEMELQCHYQKFHISRFIFNTKTELKFN